MLGTVAVEAFLRAHLGNGFLQGADHSGSKRTGNIADAEADDPGLGMFIFIGSDFVGDVCEKVTLLQLEIVLIDRNHEDILMLEGGDRRREKAGGKGTRDTVFLRKQVQRDRSYTRARPVR